MRRVGFGLQAERRGRVLEGVGQIELSFGHAGRIMLLDSFRGILLMWFNSIVGD
jgi:hypothetical protein